jgi:RNA polymerase sigma factor (sigma-70 family)
MKTLVEFLALLPADDPRPDDALLAAFRDAHDDTAFARLVRRHGPLVWGVCRRHLPPADAEDAFQATFLAVVRHLDRLSGPLGPWLHTVATRTALALRRRIDRRPVSADLESVAAPEPAEDVDALLVALPEKYRSAVVLCYLAGYTQQEAAELVGCPVGTLSARLSRGLAMLRRRAEDQPASFPVPLALSAATVRLAAAVQAGALAPAALMALTEGLFPLRWMTKAVTLAACAALAAITALTAMAMEKPKVDPRRFAPVPAEARPKDGLIVLWNREGALLLRPDGREYGRLKGEYPSDGRDAAFAPAGDRVATLVHDEDVMLQRNVYARAYKLYVRGLDEKGAGVELPADDLSFRGLVGWSRDGKRVYAMFDTVISEAKKAAAAGKKPPFGRDRAVVFDVAAKTRTVLPLADGEWLLGEGPDGQLVTTGYRLHVGGGGARGVYLTSLTRTGGIVRALPIDTTWPMTGNDQLSADGRRLLSTLFDDARQAYGLGILDLPSGKRTWLKVPGLPERRYVIERARWSPDGKRIAFYYMEFEDGDADIGWSRLPRKPGAKLCVIDADGKNLKVIREGKAEEFHYFAWK